MPFGRMPSSKYAQIHIVTVLRFQTDVRIDGRRITQQFPCQRKAHAMFIRRFDSQLLEKRKTGANAISRILLCRASLQFVRTGHTRQILLLYVQMVDILLDEEGVLHLALPKGLVV